MSVETAADSDYHCVALTVNCGDNNRTADCTPTFSPKRFSSAVIIAKAVGISVAPNQDVGGAATDRVVLCRGSILDPFATNTTSVPEILNTLTSTDVARIRRGERGAATQTTLENDTDPSHRINNGQMRKDTGYHRRKD